MSAILLFGVFTLFFLQLLTDFVHHLFAFGLLGTSIPVEIVCVLFLFSPVLLYIFRERFPNALLFGSGVVVLLTRLVEPLLTTRGRMLVSGLGAGAFLVFLPVLGWRLSRGEKKDASGSFAAGGLSALALSVLFRSLNAGVDLSTAGVFQVIGWMLAVPAAYTLWQVSRGEVPTDGQTEKSSRGQTVAASLGMVAVLTTVYFVFAAPNVLARWTGVDYPVVVLGINLSLAVFSLGFYSLPRFRALLTPGVIKAVNLLFGLALVGTILPHQLDFPDRVAGFPLYQPTHSLVAHLPLLFLILLMPVLWLDFELFLQRLTAQPARPATLAGAFTLAATFLLLLIFAHVFTTVYDYIPVIGPIFRDAFWAVHAALGLILVLAVWVLNESGQQDWIRTGRVFQHWLPALLLVSLASSAAVLWPSPIQDPLGDGESRLRVLTYNIQQGFDRRGEYNIDGQLALMQAWDPDVVGLQESGTNRISGGNHDVVRYYAERLGMHAYYGPKTVSGTFGIALLSRYPINQPQTFYMYSEGEQTAAVRAEIVVERQLIHVFVTHLGNEGPLIQQRQFLAETRGKPYLLAMGDFNFEPGSVQYAMTMEQLRDAWTEVLGREDSQELGYRKRIDHVFVSEEFTVEDAWYLDSPHSDHPALVVDLSW